MTRRKSPYVLIAKTIVSTAIFAALLSCGDPKEDSSAISIAFSPGDAPPASLETGAYAGVAATVTGDPQVPNVVLPCSTVMAPVGAPTRALPVTMAVTESLPPAIGLVSLVEIPTVGVAAPGARSNGVALAGA